MRHYLPSMAAANPCRGTALRDRAVELWRCIFSRFARHRRPLHRTVHVKQLLNSLDHPSHCTLFVVGVIPLQRLPQGHAAGSAASCSSVARRGALLRIGSWRTKVDPCEKTMRRPRPSMSTLELSAAPLANACKQSRNASRVVNGVGRVGKDAATHRTG